jgi:hypothetical protein
MEHNKMDLLCTRNQQQYLIFNIFKEFFVQYSWFLPGLFGVAEILQLEFVRESLAGV